LKRYLDAVGIITLIVLVPLSLGTVFQYAQGNITFMEYTGIWKEPMLLLFGFWLRGAANDNKEIQ
jgi:hypothetical protein